MTLSEAVVLKITPYRERDKIVKLYTPHFGLISGYVRGSKKEPLDWLQPLTLIEAHVVEKEGLCRLSELSLKKPYSALRNNLTILKASGTLCRRILKTQAEMQPQEGLYQLFTKMLASLENGLPPHTIEASFTLKLLYLEGLLCLDTKEERFSFDEWDLIIFLTQNRSIERLKEVIVEKSFVEKIEQLLF